MSFGGNQIWTPLGTPAISRDTASDIAITCDTGWAGSPIIGYPDASLGNLLTVMRYTSATGQWSAVGIAGCSPASVGSVALAANMTSVYAAFRDSGAGGKATVMQYNGIGWQTLGIAGLSAGPVAFVKILLYRGTPWISYQDSGLSGKAVLKKYSAVAGTWQSVGIEGFTAGGAAYLSIDTIADGSIWAGYRDDSQAGKLAIQKFDGNTWHKVQPAGATAASIEAASFRIIFGKAYCAFRDNGLQNRASMAIFSPQ